MGRKPAISKPLKTSITAIANFQNGVTARDLERMTGWSRATVRRRMLDSEFPVPSGKRGKQITYETLAVLEWISRFNLRVILDEEFLEYERTLESRIFADPRLADARWRVIERENKRREHLKDAIYGEMTLPSH